MCRPIRISPFLTPAEETQSEIPNSAKESHRAARIQEISRRRELQRMRPPVTTHRLHRNVVDDDVRTTGQRSKRPVELSASRILPPHNLIDRSFIIAKNQNTFAKQQRELAKKAKAAAKRARRKHKKEGGSDNAPATDRFGRRIYGTSIE